MVKNQGISERHFSFDFCQRRIKFQRNTKKKTYIFRITLIFKTLAIDEIFKINEFYGFNMSSMITNAYAPKNDTMFNKYLLSVSFSMSA